MAVLDSLCDQPDEDIEEEKTTTIHFGPLVCDSNGKEPDKKGFVQSDATCFDQIAKRKDSVRTQSYCY